MRDAQPLERGGGVCQHCVDADAQFVRGFRRRAAEIDGDDAELRTLAARPRAPARFHRCRPAPLCRFRCRAARRRPRRPRSRTAGGTATPAWRPLLVGGLARAGEQHDIALHDGGEMVFDRGMDVANVERHRQPARESIEIAHVDLALARQFQLPLQPSGELAHHDGDEDEQEQIDDLLRVADAEAVERRKEERRRTPSRRRRRQTSPRRCPSGSPRSAPGSGRSRCRGVKPDAPDDQVDHDRSRERQRSASDAMPRNSCAQAGEFSWRWAWWPASRPSFRRGAQYTPLRPCLSRPAWLHSGRPIGAFSSPSGLPERWQSG